MNKSKYPFNSNITAKNLERMLAGANIKGKVVLTPDPDIEDDMIELENKAHIQVGPSYVVFNYWVQKDGRDVMCSKDVDNFVDLLAEIKKHQLK